MRDIIHTAFGKFLSVIFPDNCVGCGKEGQVFCQNCVVKTKKQTRTKASVLFLDKLYYWGIYEDKTLSRALRRFKYQGIQGLSEPFSDILKDLITPQLSYFSNDALIVPIPAHINRKRGRGYNQAELLAVKLSEKVPIPLAPDILIKSKNTKSQTSLSGVERIFNVKNSFSVARPEFVKNKKIILVDDIITTGATLCEAAKVLKEAGANEVTGLVVAK
ncbi:hypothetical protein A3B18_00005 [Candidatus Giovannonibacteria bacterium RIFCSPLOWO2_01_FULL_46_13]|uniref:Phosphoribosyltransferase domain-containing protein n=1 Tax=Candidatus Giovannonibacteria bacterium RIFCSPLOWO2_01_FULL_46_13 TaxID=1798352 RepID=A0A1F5X6Z9_9BACT|nr:MAG: hypothetical protein A3B18_00005 [Candidatus Giovannonibacteria bacterium RIFCSPLOWO2_01_FULL_46_13]